MVGLVPRPVMVGAGVPGRDGSFGRGGQYVRWPGKPGSAHPAGSVAGDPEAEDGDGDREEGSEERERHGSGSGAGRGSGGYAAE